MMHLSGQPIVTPRRNRVNGRRHIAHPGKLFFINGRANEAGTAFAWRLS